jgi:acyl dehydratase
MKFEAEPSLAGFRLNVKNLGGRDTTGWGTSWRAINMMFQRYTGNYSPIHAQDLLPTSLTMLILRFS